MATRAAALFLAPLAALCALPPAARGQTVVVASRIPGAPATALFDVDLATGVLTGLPPFPSDALPPLAVTVDPVDHSLLLALAQPGQSRIVRLLPGASAFAEQVLGAVPGAATDLLVDSLGDVVVATGGSAGGVHRLPRHGGAASLVRAQPFVTAMAWPGLAYSAMLGLSGDAGPPPVDPGYAELDLTTGQYYAPPVFFAGFLPRGITGLVDLPTAVPRQVFAHDDGSFSLFSRFFPGNPLPLATVPVLPPGGAVAMKSLYGPALVLGGAVQPFLYGFDPTTALSGSLALNVLAGPLPGDPVDYALRPGTGAELQAFASPCGSAAELHVYGGGGLPQPGNGAFSVDLTQGLAAQPALLALGFAELAGYALPNGCLVRVLPAAVAVRATDAAGGASQPLPVPTAPAFLGLLLYAQWFQDDAGLPFVTSAVLAIRIGT